MSFSLKKVLAKLKQNGLDALILSSPASISYLAHFISRDSYFIIAKNGNAYITDSRYTEEAKKHLKGQVAIKQTNGSVFKIIADICKGLGAKRIGFEGRHLPFEEYKKLKQELGSNKDLISTYGLIEESRQIKQTAELEKIKKAVKITVEALEAAEDFILPGSQEVEVAAELERFIRYHGAYGPSFDIIVASGPNSSFPHHRTSQRRLKNNEPVLIDIGVDYAGYKSDLTRVFFLGKINFSVRRIYDIVLDAQEKAIGKIKPAASINKIDTAARQHITQEGYGGFFGHNLGHGVGLEVHEEPYISKKANNTLKKGMVFTVEPGIYLPNKFGIRIEDMVLVTESGCEVLSGALHK